MKKISKITKIRPLQKCLKILKNIFIFPHFLVKFVSCAITNFYFQTSKETAEEVEEEEEGRGSRKETLKKPGSTSIVLCSTCSKQVPKSNIELHKLKCTLELTPLAASTSKVSRNLKNISIFIMIYQ